ncbi:hypothetical protein A2U01_0057654 [Trifolium medium]|uniref:Uncharacterized protein n=1 Tax=Trifolium medium TaxID=97028 RepID=A0A392RIM0_9FABA|nr:hypothetical protein [Trifolium medium]
MRSRQRLPEAAGTYAPALAALRANTSRFTKIFSDFLLPRFQGILNTRLFRLHCNSGMLAGGWPAICP